MAAMSSKKRSFDAAFKLKVESAEKTTNRAAAREFGVDERRVREWRQMKDELEKLPRKKRRLVTKNSTSRNGRAGSGLDRRMSSEEFQSHKSQCTEVCC